MEWQFRTDVSGQRIGNIFKVVPKRRYGINRSLLHTFPEERKFHVNSGGSLFYVFSILNTS